MAVTKPRLFARCGWQGLIMAIRHAELSRLSIIGLVFLSGFSIFLVGQYSSFGMWDAYQYLAAETPCRESVYIFLPGVGHAAIWDDPDVQKKCDVTPNMTRHIRNRLATWSASADSPPKVSTKCGSKTPILLSRWHHRPNHTIHTGQTSFKVPNIVHYISIGRWKFSFLNYLSFRSVDKFIRPDYIFVVGNGLPYGYWWNRTVYEVANIYFVPHAVPERIQGRRPPWIEHRSDVLRIQTIFYNGGIYLDTDVLVVRSFDSLRRYETTLGRETYYGLGSGIIIGQQLAPFVCLWLQAYRDYNPFPWNWAYYAVHIPHRLANQFPELIHVEERSLQHPNWEEWESLFLGLYDWSHNYAIHVWKRYGHVPTGPQQITRLNTTLGEIMRYVYFGSKAIVT